MSETAKTILVIGATGSIGVPVCHFLAKSGYSLVLAARDTENLQMLCRELKSAGAASHTWICVDTADDRSIDAFAEDVAARNISVDGVVLIPPRPPRLDEPVPASNAWREFFQKSFIGPSALLKAAIATMKPDPANGRRSKVVIILGIFAASLPDELATSNLLRGAWAGEAKRLAFALGDRGIHVNTLSLDGKVAPWRGASFRRATHAETMFEQRQADEAWNATSGEWGEPDEVGIAVEILLSSFSDDMTGLDIQHDGASRSNIQEASPRLQLQGHKPTAEANRVGSHLGTGCKVTGIEGIDPAKGVSVMNVKGSIEGDDKTDTAFEELQSEMAQAFEQSFQRDNLSGLKEGAAFGEDPSADADPQSENELPAAVDEVEAPDAASVDAAANDPASEAQLTSHTQGRLASLSSFVGLFTDAQAHLKEIDAKLQEVATSHHLTREFLNVLFADTHRANQLELANTRLTLDQRKLTDQLHELGKTRQELERALEARQQREASLDRDNEALRAALAAAQLDLVEAANATAMNEAELGEAIKALSVRSVDAERGSRENEVLREKHLNLSIEFDKALSREADARRKFDEVSALHDNEATRNTELLSTVGKSEIEVLRLKKSLETAHMKLAEMADEARIVEAEGEADAVRNAAELSGLRSELQSLQTRLEHAHGERSETAAEMAQLKAQLSDTITQKLIADEKLSTLMEENERDKINLSAASTNFSELSLQQASDQIQYEVLTQECEDLRAEVATLNTRVKELLPYERLHRVTNARQNEVSGARVDIPGVETDANLGAGRNKAGSGRIRAV